MQWSPKEHLIAEYFVTVLDGLKSRSSLIFFFRLSFRNCLSCVHNIDNHSLIHSFSAVQMYEFSYIHFHVLDLSLLHLSGEWVEGRGGGIPLFKLHMYVPP